MIGFLSSPGMTCNDDEIPACAGMTVSCAISAYAGVKRAGKMT